MNEIKEKKIREKIKFFKPLSKAEQKKLNIEELSEYLKLERMYNYVNNISNISYSKKNTYPLSYIGLKGSRILVDHNRVKIIGDEREKTPRPLLYCITHIGKFDYQIVAEAIKDHAIPFAGDPETFYRTFDGAFLERNGIVYCDTYDPLDCYVGEQTMIKLLKNNLNGLIYPEAFWNVLNILVMPFFPGAIRMAMEGNADIIPVAIEQYGHKFYVNIGRNFIVNPYAINDKKYIENAKNELRNIMAFLKLDIIKKLKIEARESFGDYDEYELKFREQKFNECLDKNGKPIFSMETVNKRRFRPKDPKTGLTIQSPKEAFAYLEDIPYNEKTAFMFKADDSIPSSIGYTMYDNREQAMKENEGCKKSMEEVKSLLLKYK